MTAVQLDDLSLAEFFQGAGFLSSTIWFAHVMVRALPAHARMTRSRGAIGLTAFRSPHTQG